MKKMFLITEVILSLIIFLGIYSCKKEHSASKVAIAVIYRHDDSLFHFYADASDGSKIILDGTNSLNSHEYSSYGKCANTFYENFSLKKSDGTNFQFGIRQTFGSSINSYGLMYNAGNYNYFSWDLRLLDYKGNSSVIKHYNQAVITPSNFLISKTNGQNIANLKCKMTFYIVDAFGNMTDSLGLKNVDLLYTY